MLRKAAIQQVKTEPGEFLSNLFLVNKKDGGHRPVINLKFLNSFIPYQHFKMEGMHLIKDLLQEHDFLIKIDLKDAYFGIPLDKSSIKYIRFQWEGNLYEFLCLCFGLGPAPLIFTKLLKIPIALLRRINVRIIFLDDMLVMAQTLKEISQAKETLIFLLQNLGFLINFKKSQLTSVKEILGLVINSVNMTLVLPQEKVLDIQNRCAQLIASPKTTIMELTKLLGKLSFTAQAVLPGRIQCRYLQQQQIQVVREVNSYQTKVKLNQQSLAELKWWKENLLLQNGKPLKIGIRQLIIQTDASKTGWGQSIREPPRGELGHIRKGQNINILELIAVKLAILTFTKGKSVTAIHLQIDNMTALSYLVKMVGTRSPKLLQVAKEIWDYLLANGIAVTAEH